jgi:hypothetical protein
VVGQDYAKKVLAVSVYNHYKRIYNNAPQSKAATGDTVSTAVAENAKSQPGATLSSRGNFDHHRFAEYVLHAVVTMRRENRFSKTFILVWLCSVVVMSEKEVANEHIT